MTQAACSPVRHAAKGILTQGTQTTLDDVDGTVDGILNR